MKSEYEILATLGRAKAEGTSIFFESKGFYISLNDSHPFVLPADRLFGGDYRTKDMRAEIEEIMFREAAAVEIARLINDYIERDKLLISAETEKTENGNGKR